MVRTLDVSDGVVVTPPTNALAVWSISEAIYRYQKIYIYIEWAKTSADASCTCLWMCRVRCVQDEDEDVLLVSEWAPEDALGSIELWEDPVLLVPDQQQVPPDGPVPDIDIGTVDMEGLLGDDDEDVLFVGDYVPELEAGEGEGKGLATKVDEGGELPVVAKASAAEGDSGPNGTADRSAEVRK